MVDERLQNHQRDFQTRRTNIFDALIDIEKLDVVKGKIVKIRIEELDS